MRRSRYSPVKLLLMETPLSSCIRIWRGFMGIRLCSHNRTCTRSTNVLRSQLVMILDITIHATTEEKAMLMLKESVITRLAKRVRYHLLLVFVVCFG